MYKKVGLDNEIHNQPGSGFGGRAHYNVDEYGVGNGPAMLASRRSSQLTSLAPVDQPPAGGSVRKNFVSGGLPMVVWFAPENPDLRFSGLENPQRPFEMRRFKNSPAYFLSKALRGITYDENNIVVPFATVILKRTDTNAVVAATVSDAAGNYYFTVAE